MNWQKAVERFEAEARAVLRRQRLPGTAEGLRRRHIQPKNSLTGAAMLVLYGAHYLRRELAAGHCEGALARLLQVCAEYDEMQLHRDVPSARGPLINKVITNATEQGLRQRKHARAGGLGRRTPLAQVRNWKRSATRFKKKNPSASKNSTAHHVARQCGGRVRTITRYI